MRFVVVLVDNSVVPGRDTERHLRNLRDVLTKLPEANLTVGKKRYLFF